jgi:hypothetical protein
VHRLCHGPNQTSEQECGSDRVGVGQRIQMDGIGRGANVLDTEIGEHDPEQLDELNRD